MEDAIRLLPDAIDDTASAEKGSSQWSKQMEVDRIAARVRWCTVTVVTIPIGVVIAVDYFRTVARLGVRSKYHKFTVAATWMCALGTIGILVAAAIWLVTTL